MTNPPAINNRTIVNSARLLPAIGRTGATHLYQQIKAVHACQKGGRAGLYGWLDAVLSVIGARYETDCPKDFTCPTQGPLIIVANHPFGLKDPLVLGHLFSRLRPDLRIVANPALLSVNELRDHLITADGSDADAGFIPVGPTVAHLQAGGAVIIFPSGQVARYRPGQGVREAAWSDRLGEIVLRSGANVVPVYFSGSNSVLFHTAQLLRPKWGPNLLLREFLTAKKEPVPMKIGQVITAGRLKKYTDTNALTQYLRLHTMVLSQRSGAGAKPSAVTPGLSPIVMEDRSQHLRTEIETLRASGNGVVAQGNLEVFAASAMEIPVALREIGRLREITFRAVGEGTGNDIDLDSFDAYYQHLFLWDETAGKIVGAYRLGRADQILSKHGARGLYTNTLFRFQRPFLKHLHDAVEMGRSFIRPEYQRQLSALPLLWRGIAQWIGRHPQYTKLFGPVSISQDYDPVSRRLIVEYLTNNRSDAQLAGSVRPRKPFKCKNARSLLREIVSTSLTDAEDCSAVISSLEADGKGLPVLLKHYLKLNGTILSFNVDKNFSSVLDGLILVDLRKTEPRLLTKMMGGELLADYQRYHGLAPF
ncbi:MAG: lysophospholipid acyltransferase family protein [Verrucomicrobiales bacterium]|nr:lysophospholipid acyltransferase family protein [Verrucomicrobiales bacterium]